MKDYYLVEINPLPFVKQSTVIVDNIVCPIIGSMESDECVRELLTGVRIFKNNNEKNGYLTYSNLTKLTKEELKRYYNIFTSLNEKQAKEYDDYIKNMIQKSFVDYLEYKHYSNQLELLEHDFDNLREERKELTL